MADKIHGKGAVRFIGQLEATPTNGMIYIYYYVFTILCSHLVSIRLAYYLRVSTMRVRCF